MSDPSNMVTEATESQEITARQQYGLAILCLVVSCFDILGNILIIVVYARTPALHVASRCLIVAVSVADINMGLVDLSHVYPFMTGEWTLGRETCGVVLSMGFAGLAFSMLCIMCISIERYVAVLHPLKYVTLMPPRRVWGMLCACAGLVGCVWAVVVAFTIRDAASLILPHCAMASPNYPVPATIFMNGACVVSASVVLFTNIRVLRVARKQAKQIAAQPQGVPAPGTAKKVTVSDLKAAFTLITLSLVFTVAMVPGLVFIAIAEGQDEQVTNFVRMGQMISAILMGLNGSANIFIYMAFNSKFRQGLRNVLVPCSPAAVVPA